MLRLPERKHRIRAHCTRCGHEQLFVEVEISHLVHLAVTFATFGLWLVGWLSVCVSKIMRPWRCEHCGWHKPEFRHLHPQLASPARRLPDPNICHAKPIGDLGALAKCLVDSPASCRHALKYENGHLCTHPDWKDFSAQKDIKTR